MIDLKGLRQILEFNRGRTLATIDEIEKSGHADQFLGWRPGPGRAHSAWQLLHLAATDDRMLNVRIRGGEPVDKAFVEGFGGGSTPSDSNVPSLAAIRTALESNRSRVLAYLESLSDADLDRELPGNRTLRDWLLILGWHEAHHQGQVHLTFNLFKATQV